MNDDSLIALMGNNICINKTELCQSNYLITKVSISSPGPHDIRCWFTKYVNRRICALEGQSVDISSRYFESWEEDKSWYRLKTLSEENSHLLKEDGHVEFDNSEKNVHVLRINNVERNNSGLYVFKFKDFGSAWTLSERCTVTLVVTGNKEHLFFLNSGPAAGLHSIISLHGHLYPLNTL